MKTKSLGKIMKGSDTLARRSLGPVLRDVGVRCAVKGHEIIPDHVVFRRPITFVSELYSC